MRLFLAILFLVISHNVISQRGVSTVDDYEYNMYRVSSADTITVKHTGYVSTFSVSKRYPVIVKWLDTKARLSCVNKTKRRNNFKKDPTLPEYTDLSKSYTHSGLSRGHNCPADDNSCDSVMQVECFYYSNMCPQYQEFNAGIWLRLEDYTRRITMIYDSVYVWCGSVGEAKRIGSVSVPEFCWKVLYIKATKCYMCYIFKNTEESQYWDPKNTVPISKVEELTGFKFNINSK